MNGVKKNSINIIPIIVITCVITLIILVFLIINTSHDLNVTLTPDVKIQTEIDENGDYKIIITYISKDTSLKYIEIRLYNTNNNTVLSGNMIEIDNLNNITFVDSDDDNKLSENDFFIINNNTERSGYMFEMIFYPSGAVMDSIIL